MKWLVALVACLWASSIFGQVPGPSTGTGYPSGSIPLVVGVTGTTGAVTASLPGSPGRLTYMCGLHIDAAGSGAIGPITITGLAGGTTWTYQATAGNSGTSPPVQTYSPCIPANAANTAIVVTTSADGTASAVDINTWGYQLPIN